ncbi:hypothetical protein GCM10010329_64850 [Streptomyces spiroverticillatus]|nr:hypothetical protein GCM10010329_64850 [Streptomyces spiroverticillatus]
MDQPLSSVRIDRAPSFPEFVALMTHGTRCAACMAGALCPDGERLMAVHDAKLCWRKQPS